MQSRVSWLVLCGALTGCGRVGFDAQTVIDDASADTPPGDVGPVGHDEDGDGVADSVDVCPHLAGPPVGGDSDGDGVGDACDPEPANPRQRLALFSALTPADSPVTTTTNGVVLQQADAITFDGRSVAALNLTVPAYGDVQITVGLDIVEVLAPASQHQLALHTAFDLAQPHYFVELNEFQGMFTRAEIALYNNGYFTAASTPLATGVHPGPMTLQFTGVAGSSVALLAGWPGESYVLSHANTIFQGGTTLRIDVKNLAVAVRYLCIVTST